MKRKRNYRICLIGDRYGKGGRDRLSGVLRFAAEVNDWSLRIVLLGTPNSIQSLKSILATQEPEGLLVLSCDKQIASLIQNYQSTHSCIVPTMTVDLDDRLNAIIHHNLHVQLDNVAIAQAAMRLLLRRGYSNFAYVGYGSERQISDARRDAIRHIAESDGFPFFTIDETDDISSLSDWLKGLPAPCGVITYYDILSRDVLDACRLARLNVPEQIAIVGSDDDSSICEATSPALSSVLPDFENGMYLAAAEFNRLLHRRNLPRKPVRMIYGVKSTSERESTIDLHGGGMLVSTACEFIRENAAKHISVPDVAAHCRVSRRLLELRFRQVQSLGVRDKIEQVRLQTVRELLRRTHLPLKEIGKRAGFSSQAYLCTLFQKRFGCTMREYRVNRQVMQDVNGCRNAEKDT